PLLVRSRRLLLPFFFSSRRRHTRFSRDWSSDVCSSDLRSVTKLEKAFCPESLRAHPRPGRLVRDASEATLNIGRTPGRQSGENRSEERRVGKECRSRWWPHHWKYNKPRTGRSQSRVYVP